MTTPTARSLAAIFALLLLQGAHASLTEQAGAANAALLAGRPREAATQYRTLLDDPAFRSSASPELWYNRGLCEEKAGDPAMASLCFRRALVLDPGFVPAGRRLTTVLTSLGLPAATGWNDPLRGAVHPEVLIIGGAALGWIALFATLILFFLQPRRRRLLAVAIVLVILGHGAAVFGTLIDPRRQAAGMAVITAKASPTLRATPADSGNPGGTVQPGTLVSVLSRNGSWWYVSGGPGLTGWIPADTVTSLLPSAGGS
jgi:hypothetical protein